MMFRLWFGIALGLLLGISAQAAENALKAEQVAERVWFVQGAAALGSPANRNFISNAGFVVTDDGVLVVDALGSPALAVELLAEIRRVTPQPVRFVVVTHYHADHIYGLQAFKAAGAVIVAHSAGRDYLTLIRRSSGCKPAGRISPPGSMPRPGLCLPTAGWTATRPAFA